RARPRAMASPCLRYGTRNDRRPGGRHRGRRVNGHACHSEGLVTVGGLVLCEPTRGCVLMGYLLRKDDDDARYQDEDALDFEMQTKRWVVFVVGCNGLAGVSCACCTSIVTSTLVSTSY